MTDTDYTYPLYARFVHLGLAVFGTAAYLTAEFAEDGADQLGYLLHAYLGLSLAAFVGVRMVHGIAGPAALRFAGWSPLSRRQWRTCLDDIRSLARLEVPERGMHQGLAGITQALGIALFALMGATGTGIFFLDGPHESPGLEALEELHEAGETLVPLYLALHVGSVVVHALAGHPIWRRMWTFYNGERP